MEDHPIEYFDFEGVIPKGEYGGGDVIVWDWGTWQPSGTDDPAGAIERGELHFDLQGEKLASRFLPVRSCDARSGKEQWLLLHKNDDHARPGWDPEDLPQSVKSGRTNEEVAAAPEALWRSGVPAGEAAVRPAGAPRSAWDPPMEDELAALDAIGSKGRWPVQGHEVTLTNVDKVLFPARHGEHPVTKRNLVRYHAVIAPFMLPYLAGRPVNPHRYPDGVERPGFWHKEVPSHAPQWLTRWRNSEADPGETACYAVIDSVATLAWMANYAAVELHPWTSRLPDTHQPTWALIDIDPGSRSSFDDVLVLARLYRVALEHLGVAAMPKVTGQRGVQIWVPIRSGYTFDDTRAWVEKVSRTVGRTVPDLISWEWQKDRRQGLARLDYTRTPSTRRWWLRSALGPPPGRRCPSPSAGRSSTIRICDPTAGPSGR